MDFTLPQKKSPNEINSFKAKANKTKIINSSDKDTVSNSSIIGFAYLLNYFIQYEKR